jgi:ADP-ribose pyrophosphatase YjhB (NUDIX family)
MQQEQARHMITFSTESGRFNMRLVAVITDGERVLLHRAETDDFWTLPGGRAELLEPAREGLAREMREELGVEVQVGRLLWVVENFFEYVGEAFHELALVFHVALPESSGLTNVDTFNGHEDTLLLIFRWFHLDELQAVYLLPSFLKDGLRNLPQTTEYIVHVDEKP